MLVEGTCKPRDGGSANHCTLPVTVSVTIFPLFASLTTIPLTSPRNLPPPPVSDLNVELVPRALKVQGRAVHNVLAVYGQLVYTGIIAHGRLTNAGYLELASAIRPANYTMDGNVRLNETNPRELTKELFDGLYGQSWWSRPLPMWLNPTYKHFELTESARTWALRASE